MFNSAWVASGNGNTRQELADWIGADYDLVGDNPNQATSLRVILSREPTDYDRRRVLEVLKYRHA